MIGKVKWFDSKKGYGFILTDEGVEVFVHYTGIEVEGFKALTEGQNVEFEIEDNQRGRQAVGVKVLPKKKE
ncbi:MAG: cold-shock protein [Alistipes sp.]|nr:cold-shock protein [Alistipes sp.]